MVEFEWDEAKNRSNIEKHGIHFEDVLGIFDGVVIVGEDTMKQDHKSRKSKTDLDRLRRMGDEEIDYSDTKMTLSRNPILTKPA